MGKALLLTVLVLLAACEPALHTIPTSEHQSPVEEELVVELQDVCEDVTCPTGQVCQEGACGCPTGKKLCDEKCITSSACCTDDDCDSGSCEKSVCVTPEECRFNEEWKDGECACAEDHIYCREQDKCIGRNDCCVHSQCDRFQRCVPTNLRASFCIKIDEKKQCKIISDLNRTELFEVKDYDFRINATEWWHDGSVTFSVNNESVHLDANATQKYSNETLDVNVTLFHEGIEITGGFCKDDEED